MRRKASMIVLAVLMAAGAIWTAVYDICLSKIKTVSPILNAAGGKQTIGAGLTYWRQVGSARNAGDSYEVTFDDGTWMVVFEGQCGAGGTDINGVQAYGQGAACIAFYKGSSMNVTIGVGGGKGSAEDGSRDGGGKTIVATNFAKPIGFDGVGVEQAIAAGGGAGNFQTLMEYYRSFEQCAKMADGTFKGWDCNGWSATKIKLQGNTHMASGVPATQGRGGYSGHLYWEGYLSTGQGEDYGITPNGGIGGGAGFYDGGSGYDYYDGGAGGSCSPNCYPLLTSDAANGFLINRVDPTATYDKGVVFLFRIDPTREPGDSQSKQYGVDGYGIDGKGISITPGSQPGTDEDSRYTPVNAIDSGESTEFNGYDCGIEGKWVYSVRVGGEWEGLAPEKPCYFSRFLV